MLLTKATSICKPKTYIILLNYNGWEDTLECLESVLKIDYSNYQIVVVDNASPNNSMEKICDWAEGKLEAPLADESMKNYSCPHEQKPIKYTLLSRNEAENGKAVNDGLVFINAEENGGFAAGNNIAIRWGLKQKDAEYFLLLNNDTVVERNFLNKLMDNTLNVQNQGLTGSLIKHYYNNSRIWYSGGKHVLYKPIFSETKKPHSEKEKTDCISGCSMLISKHLINNIGILNEKYFMYYEDAEYSYKSKQAEFTNYIISNSLVYHKINQSSEGTSGFSYNRMITKSYLQYFKYNHGKIFIPFVICCFVPVMIKRILQFLYRRKIKGIKGIFSGIYDFLKKG